MTVDEIRTACQALCALPFHPEIVDLLRDGTTTGTSRMYHQHEDCVIISQWDAAWRTSLRSRHCEEHSYRPLILIYHKFRYVPYIGTYSRILVCITIVTCSFKKKKKRIYKFWFKIEINALALHFIVLVLNDSEKSRSKKWKSIFAHTSELDVFCQEYTLRMRGKK